MKKVMLCLGLVAIVLLVAGCGMMKLTPEAEGTPNATTVYVNGEAALMCAGTKAMVIVSGGRPEDQENELFLRVAWKNVTTESYDIVPATTTVEAVGKNGVQHLKVYEADEYMKALKIRQGTALFLNALAGAYTAYNASHTTTYTSASIYGPGGYSSAFATTTIYNPALAQQMAFQNSMELDRQADNDKAERVTMDKVLARRTTLFPDQIYEGIIPVKCALEPDSIEKYIVTLTVNDEIFTMTFRPLVIR